MLYISPYASGIVPHNLKLFVILGLEVVLLAIFWVFRDKFYVLERNSHRETLRRLNASRSDSCNYCGTPFVALLRKRGSPYCGILCSFAAGRRVYLSIGYVLLIINYQLQLQNLNLAGILLLVVGSVGMILHTPRFMYRNQGDESPRHQNLPIQTHNESKEGRTQRNKKTLYVEALKRDINICCYQTARLGEKYCPCGLAISDDVISMISGTISSD